MKFDLETQMIEKRFGSSDLTSPLVEETKQPHERKIRLLRRVLSRRVLNLHSWTPKWPLRLILAWNVTASKLVPLLRHLIRDVTSNHVSRPCELFFVLDPSSHLVAVGFAILCSQRWILVSLNASTVAFIEIWGNCPCLLFMFTNTTLNLGFEMLTLGQL